MLEKLKQFIEKLNSAGVPIPLIRLDGKPTLTGSMAFISFNTCLLGQIGKIAGFFGGIDLSQANYLFLMCLGAYLGRRMQATPDKKQITFEETENK